ncbi:DUF707 domain-containing protein [Methylacidiphilum caldifontis]|uniref:DUF707 domain-containing protein n=1 Tax=Methylacidiphilum caldifontis TaxID=2795386 RepID=UPI001A8F63F6|nr:DUF707 domain-containing protein [Methylacidiphilum caldifontis]QSR89624.1 DUF707 domain-containing protein [Methylacidiphilum caldifontis]
MNCKGKIGVIGVYYLNRASLIRHLVKILSSSQNWDVEQRWAALGQGEIDPELKAYTLKKGSFWKFSAANQLIPKESSFDYIFLCDDDVELPDGFLDHYMEWVLKYGFDLSQPARSHQSFIDHPFTEKIDGIKARLTRYVEIGPVVCISRRALELLFPFPEFPPSGWGLDYHWPVILQKSGLKLGIIDQVSCIHNFRIPVKYYEQSNPWKEMEYFLSVNPHLKKEEAFQILEVYV